MPPDFTSMRSTNFQFSYKKIFSTFYIPLPHTVGGLVEHWAQAAHVVALVAHVWALVAQDGVHVHGGGRHHALVHHHPGVHVEAGVHVPVVAAKVPAVRGFHTISFVIK